MTRSLVALAAATALVLGVGPAFAQKAEKLKELKLGSGNAGFGVSQKDWTFTLNKKYSWKISSEGKHECDFESPFFETLTIEKLEIENITLERPKIEEIEFGEDDESDVEIVFTPTKAGEYTWVCRGLDVRGMTGKFIVK